MKHAIAPMLLGLLLITASCSGELPVDADNGSESATIPASDSEPLVLDNAAAEGAESVTSEGGSQIFDPDCLITENSVASIAVPSTLGEFADAFPAGTRLSFYANYMVDFGALCARAGNEDALCAIFESYEVEDFSRDIESIALAVYSPVCRTEAGFGPATPVADVAAAIGPATFGFSYDNEGREYVSFENAPGAFSFRAESVTGEAQDDARTRPAGRHGGDYTGVEGDSYFETERAHPDARLWEIWISDYRE